MPRARSLAERFWKKVDTSGDCWLWTGAAKGGYGQIISSPDEHGRVRVFYAHRVAWEVVKGPIPEGMLVARTCGNRLCVNPDHLKLMAVEEQTRPFTDLQAAFADVDLPDEPPGCSRRDWAIFLAHVRNGLSQSELAKKYNLTRSNVSSIVNAVGRKVRNPPERPHMLKYRPIEIHERPDGVSERNWEIYKHHVRQQETKSTIARKFGLSVPRISAIIREVHQRGSKHNPDNTPYPSW